MALIHLVAGVLGAGLILAVLREVFETIVLPRRVTRRLRFVRLLYRTTWGPWRWIAGRLSGSREGLLSTFGPLALLALLVLWMASLLVGFAAVQWAGGPALRTSGGAADFGATLYFIATTLLTLGLGDVSPSSGAARLLTVLEVACGFGVLALVIGYLPTLYQAFSRREVAVSLLDARAGSPPSAGELLRRYAADNHLDGLDGYLRDWEVWAAELMESHLSYPMLAYFRSQHDNQSWLAALTTILDTCSLVLAAVPSGPTRRARLTYAMCRHALVDLAQVFQTPPLPPRPERLDTAALERLRHLLEEEGLAVAGDDHARSKLDRLRASYEPYANALAQHLALPLPPWLPAPEVTENWRSTAWESGGRPIF